MVMRRVAMLRFLESIKPTECWEWQGLIEKNGYGRFHFDKKRLKAHRVSYEQFFGSIPDGLTLDHLCRNRKCVNPLHLEPVTARVNTLRGTGVAAMNSRKVNCKRGHPLNGRNLYPRKDGHRECRTCVRLRRAGLLKS